VTRSAALLSRSNIVANTARSVHTTVVPNSDQPRG